MKIGASRRLRLPRRPAARTGSTPTATATSTHATTTPRRRGRVGLALGGVDVAIALLKTIPPATADPAPPRSVLRDQGARRLDRARRRRRRDASGHRHRHRGQRRQRQRPTARLAASVPAPVVDFNAADGGESLPVTVDAETGATLDLDFAGARSMAHGRVTVAFDGFSIATTITFTQRLRANGTKVTFIALTDTDFAVGDRRARCSRSATPTGFFVLTPLGMAAELTVADDRRSHRRRLLVHRPASRSRSTTRTRSSTRRSCPRHRPERSRCRPARTCGSRRPTST